MALNHEKNGRSGEKRQIFTFYVEDMMFGLNVENVLMLSQDVQNIQRLPIEERGFCGVTKFQGIEVPVLDFAHRIGIPSGIDSKTELLLTLAQRESEHIEWFESLESAAKAGLKSAQTVSLEECKLRKWYKNFETRDESLKDLFLSFEKPDEELHILAETVSSLISSDNKTEATILLENARHTLLQRLLTIFSRVRDQINSSMRQVLLFVTDDGQNPRYALKIDEINDVINYRTSDFQSSDKGPLSVIRKIEGVIDGIYMKKDKDDCLYFNTNSITDIDFLMEKVN